MTEPKPQLSKQLREFQSKIKPIKKAGKNPHYKSTYAKHEDVFEYFLPLLSESGLSMYQYGKDHNDNFYLITVISNDFGEKIESLWPVCKSDLDIQKKCAASSYISRYSVMRMLGLSATDEDHDGNDVTLDVPTYIAPKGKDITKLSQEELDHTWPGDEPQKSKGTTVRISSEALRTQNVAPIETNPLITVEALVKYEDRNIAKTAGFKFDKDSKRWLKQIPALTSAHYPFEVREVQ